MYRIIHSGLFSNSRPIYDADPGSWPQKVKFEYSKKTSTTSLRPHIHNIHREKFLEARKKYKWKVLLPEEVSEARSKAASEASGLRSQPEVKFNLPSFHQALLKFIVADDQVSELSFLTFSTVMCNHQSLNIVECPEFRQLLLLHGNLKDSDIPHRTRLRELLLQAWKEYFQELRSNFAVRPPSSFSISFIFLNPGCDGPHFVYDGHMVRSNPTTLFSYYRPLDRAGRGLNLTTQVSPHRVSSAAPHT